MSRQHNDESLLREAQMQRDEENGGNLGCSIESVQVQIQNGTSTQILQENTTGCVEILIVFEDMGG